MKQEEGEKEGKRKGRLSITARFPHTESPSSSFKFWSNLRKREDFGRGRRENRLVRKTEYRDVL